MRTVILLVLTLFLLAPAVWAEEELAAGPSVSGGGGEGVTSSGTTVNACEIQEANSRKAAGLGARLPGHGAEDASSSMAHDCASDL